MFCYSKKDPVLKAFENQFLKKIFDPTKRDVNDKRKIQHSPIFFVLFIVLKIFTSLASQTSRGSTVLYFLRFAV